MLSEFYRTLRSLIGLSTTANTVSILAAYTISPFWGAGEVKIATANAVPDTRVIANVPGLSDRLAPVLHLAVVWGALVQLDLAAPEPDTLMIPHSTIIKQLERLLQSFADISPCRTLDQLTRSLSVIAGRVLILPQLDKYRIAYTPLSQEPPSVRVEITHCA